MDYRIVAMAAAAPACLASPDPRAETLSSDRLSVNGFGTLGGVYSDSDTAAFIRDLSQPEGAIDGWSAEVDSRLGLQLSFRPNARPSVALLKSFYAASMSQ